MYQNSSALTNTPVIANFWSQQKNYIFGCISLIILEEGPVFSLKYKENAVYGK